MPYSLEVQYQQRFGIGEFDPSRFVPFAEYPDFFYQPDLHHEAVFTPGKFNEAIVVSGALFPDSTQHIERDHESVFVGRVFDPLAGDFIKPALYPDFFYQRDLHHEAVFTPNVFPLHDHAPEAEYPEFFYQVDLHHEAIFTPGQFDEALEESFAPVAEYTNFFYQPDLHHEAVFVGRVFDPLSGDFIKPAVFPDFLVFEEDYQSGQFFTPGVFPLHDHAPVANFPDLLPFEDNYQEGRFFTPGQFDAAPVDPFSAAAFIEVFDENIDDEAPFMQFVFSRVQFERLESEQAVTKLDVFNIAGIALGYAEGVNDPDENTTLAAVLRKRWTTARRSFLEEHPYNGCKRTAVLSKSPTDPVDRWTNMFVLPYDCLRVLTINGNKQSDGTDAWEIEYDPTRQERVLLTDASTATASMIVDVVDLTHLKTKVVEAMGLYLAYQVNEVFPMSKEKRRDLKNKMDHAASLTKGADGQEGTPPRRTESFLVQSRKRRR